MKGQTKMTLSNESVREALEQYLNRHLLSTAQVSVGKWDAPAPAPYGTQQSVEVEVEEIQVIEQTTPFPLSQAT